MKAAPSVVVSDNENASKKQEKKKEKAEKKNQLSTEETKVHVGR